MSLRKSWSFVFVVSMVVGVFVACVQPFAWGDPGITDTKVKIGGVCPSSGPLSSFATVCASEEAYFKYVNEKFGGVTMGDGKTRKIEYVWYDDAYSPPRTVEQVKRLAEQDQVFLVLAPLGTPTNLAVWDYLNRKGIPHLYVGSGATIWGGDVNGHPWTMGWQPAYSTEASIYAEFVKEKMSNAKVAALYQNDDFGKDLLGSFKRAIQGSNLTVVAAESYETSHPTVDSQVTNLAASKADVFLIFTIPKFAAQAIKKTYELGWRPLQITDAIAGSIKGVLIPAGIRASTGVYTGAYVKDPTSPQWVDDPGMKLFWEIAKKYGSSNLDPDNQVSMIGFGQAEQLVYTLKHTKQPTRKALMESARHQTNVSIMALLPGVKVTVDGAKDPYPVESMQMSQFNGQQYELVGAPITRYEGRTPPSGVEYLK